MYSKTKSENKDDAFLCIYKLSEYMFTLIILLKNIASI